MRRIFLLLLAVVVACDGSSGGGTTTVTSAPAPASTTSVDFDDFVLYEAPDHGFSIAHPRDWTVTEVEAENLIGFTAPQSTESLTPNFNITVTEVSDELPPAAYYEGEIERVRTSLENAEILEVANVNIDGVIGRGLTLITRQSEIDIGISRVIVINEGRAYELSFFAAAPDLEELAPLVTTIFQSFGFIE